MQTVAVSVQCNFLERTGLCRPLGVSVAPKLSRYEKLIVYSGKLLLWLMLFVLLLPGKAAKPSSVLPAC